MSEAIERMNEEAIPSAPLAAVDFINLAASYVGGPREETHGDKGTCFHCMGAADEFIDRLQAISGTPPSPGVESALRMILYKMARVYSGRYNADDFVDMAGYAGCAGEVAALDAAQSEG